MRTVTYQSSRQSSNHVKVHSGNAVRNSKSRYGKGIRPTYTVLQIKADSPVNGADVFWYEGNCSILGSKNVYIGYSDNSMSVLSQFELVMTIISGAFLLFHAVSARLLSKKNPYGGKLFWFFKFWPVLHRSLIYFVIFNLMKQKNQNFLNICQWKEYGYVI